MSEVNPTKKIAEDIQNAKKQASEEIAQLRKQQKQAIENTQYDEAEKIQKQIEELNIKTENYAMDTVYEHFNENLTAVIQKILEDDQIMAENEKLRESKLKMRFDRQFKIARIKQLRKIKQIEDQFKAQRQLEINRYSPQQNELLEKSKKAATNGDFETARSLYEESNKVAKEETEQRLKVIEEDFTKQRDELINLFGIEMKNLTQKFNYEKSRLEEQKQERKRVSEINKSNQLSGFCQKYTKLATNYASGAKGERLAMEIQQIYLDKCKLHEIKPTQFQIEQNLNSKKKMTLTPETKRPQTRSSSRTSQIRH